MSVLVYTENWDGKFKKSSFELVSFAAAMAAKAGSNVVALSIGNVEETELKKLAEYGADKILSVTDDRLKSLANGPYSSVIEQAVKASGANIVLLAHNFTGKALAPRISVKLKAGLASAVTAVPESMEPFVITKRVFNGSAFAKVNINTPVRVLTLLQNSFETISNPKAGAVEAFAAQIDDSQFRTSVKETKKLTGKVLLNDAEIVVSGGRGMKGAENWKPLEELADVLGGATACSRPVSDEGWRPHHEHVGQTGKIVAPNLYFALGISGAIQHIAGVSGSKVMVAVNKDPEAPVFETATYGVVGDVQKVLPDLINAIKEMKASQ